MTFDEYCKKKGYKITIVPDNDFVLIVVNNEEEYERLSRVNVKGSLLQELIENYYIENGQL